MQRNRSQEIISMSCLYLQQGNQHEWNTLNEIK